MHEARIAGLRDLGVGAVVGTRPVIGRMVAGATRPMSGKRRMAVRPRGTRNTICPTSRDISSIAGMTAAQDFTVARGAMKLGVQILPKCGFSMGAALCPFPRRSAAGAARKPHASVEKWLAGGQTAAVCSGAYCHHPPGGPWAARPISAVSDGSLIRKATSSRPRALTIPSPQSRSTPPSHGTANEPIRATYRSSLRAAIFLRNSALGACRWRNAVR